MGQRITTIMHVTNFHTEEHEIEFGGKQSMGHAIGKIVEHEYEQIEQAKREREHDSHSHGGLTTKIVVDLHYEE